MLSDRVGTRQVVLLGGAILGVGMLALSRMHALWHLYVFYGMLVGGGVGAFTVPLTSTVMRWFSQRRGLVVAIANCGIGLGGMLLAPLTRVLVLAMGWRATFLFYGLLVWAVLLPLALLIRNRPQDIGLLPYGSTASELVSVPAMASRVYTFGQALATPAFWIIASAHFLCCTAHAGPIFHMVSALIDTGVDKLAAASVFAIASLCSIPGRVGTGLLADRFGSKTILVIWLGMQASAILFYLFASSFGGFVLLAAYFGLSFGGVMPLYPVITREYFGAQAMGASYGAIFLLSCVGMGLGAWLGGRIFDSTGAYTDLYVLSALLSGLGAVCTLWLRAPETQHQAAIVSQTVRI
jgi:MFS family permease